MQKIFYIKQKEILKLFKSSKFSSFIFLSSANARGIAKYSQTINDELDNSSIIFPFYNYKNKVSLFLREQIINFLIMIYIILLNKILFPKNTVNFIFPNSRLPLFSIFIKYIKNINLYIILHDAMEINLEFRLNKLILKLNSILIYISILLCDFIIYNSYSTKETFNKLFIRSKNKKDFIYITINKKLPSQEEIYSEIKLKKINLYSICGITKFKNLNAYIELIKYFNSKQSLVNYFLTGVDNQYLSNQLSFPVLRLKNNIFGSKKGDKQLSNANYFSNSYIDDSLLYSLYLNANYFISLSSNEGFGIPVFEALRFGVNVILSDISVYRELVEMFNNLGILNSQVKFVNIEDPYLFQNILDGLSKEIISKNIKIQRVKNYNQSGNIINNIYNSKLIKNLLGDDQYK